MNKVLVDSSVLLDLFTNDPVWAGRSQTAIARILESASLPCTNDMVYAEVSVGFRRIEDCDAALEDIGIVHEAIPKEALFLAGKAFLSYRRNGGTKTAILPDFIIGAHAAIRGYPLLTRDPARVESAYPRLLILRP